MFIKKNYTSITTVIFFIVLSSLLSSIFFFLIGVFDLKFYISILEDVFINNIFYYLFLIFFQLIFFSLGLPTTPFLLFNLSINIFYGFVISIITLFFASILIFKFAVWLKKNLKLNFKIIKYKKKIFGRNTQVKIFLSRFLIPFFFHNIIFGLMGVSLRQFIFSAMLADALSLSILIMLAKNIT
jgi:uncharacterized membrane protein YdjX (TVP38/TMEM64 family)